MDYNIDLKNYANQDVIKVFHKISMYFTDHFYNRLYRLAKDKKTKDDSNQSLTEIYKRLLQSYTMLLHTEQRSYVEVVKFLYDRYQTLDSSTSSLTDFISMVVRQYIPEEFHRVASEKEKDVYFCGILKDIIHRYVSEIIKTENLTLIIDNRNLKNVEYMIELFEKIQVMKREDLLNEFLKQQHKVKHVNTIPIHVVQKIKDELQNQVQLRVSAEARIKQLENIISGYNRILPIDKINDLITGKYVIVPATAQHTIQSVQNTRQQITKPVVKKKKDKVLMEKDVDLVDNLLSETELELPKSDSETESESENESIPESESESDTETDTGSESDSESESESKPDSAAVSKQKLKNKIARTLKMRKK